MTSVAIVHDTLATRGGAERVVLAMAEAFPDAPIHTVVYDPGATFADFARHRVVPSWLDRVGPLRRNYRATFPLASTALTATRIDADVVVCSTAGLAHHVRSRGAKLVYCYSPSRWLHDATTYMQGHGSAVKVTAALVRPGLTALDRAAMRRSDRVLAISPHVRGAIRAAYGLDAPVVAPCSTLDVHGPVRPVDGVAARFVLSPVRALGYKRLDLLTEAARALPRRKFVHVGDGPWRAALVQAAPANLVSLGGVDDAQLRWLYRNASVVALTWAEDFGLVPLEADAHGLTTVAPGARGFVDHPSIGLRTYEPGSVDALVDAIEGAAPATGTLDATQLGVARFTERLRLEVAELA